MKTGAKVWLWIVLVLGALGLLGNLTLFLANPLIAIIYVAASVLIVAGCAVVLFKFQKLGFYLLIAGYVVNGIMNIVIGGAIISGILGMILVPLITYLVIKNDLPNMK